MTVPPKALCTRCGRRPSQLRTATKRRIVIVATDLIGLPREITDLVSTRAQQEYGIERSQIMFNSTHTHSGPVVWPNLMTMFNLATKR